MCSRKFSRDFSFREKDCKRFLFGCVERILQLKYSPGNKIIFFLFWGNSYFFFPPPTKKKVPFCWEHCRVSKRSFMEWLLVRRWQISNLESSKCFFYFLVFEKLRGREETTINAPTWYYKVALLEKYLVKDGWSAL